MRLIIICALLAVINFASTQTEVTSPFMEFDRTKQFTFPLEEDQIYCEISWCFGICKKLLSTYKNFNVTGVKAFCTGNCICELERRVEVPAIVEE